MTGNKKFHISPDGIPRPCSAKPGNCEYAENGIDPPHYKTKEEAREAYTASKNNTPPSHKKNKKEKSEKNLTPAQEFRARPLKKNSFPKNKVEHQVGKYTISTVPNVQINTEGTPEKTYSTMITDNLDYSKEAFISQTPEEAKKSHQKAIKIAREMCVQNKEKAEKILKKYEDEKYRNTTREPRKPIIVEDSPYREPKTYLDFGTVTNVEDLYYGDYSEMTEVYPKKAIEEMTGIPEKEWTKDLRKVYEDNKENWEDINSWSFEKGYYETDSPEFYGPEDMEDKIKGWYYSQNNANDEQGVLRHVREKGYDTTGLTPVDALKKMLREENNGMILRSVENATSVRKIVVPIDQVSYAQNHYDRIGALEPKPVDENSEEISGVIKRDPKGQYKLIDGHHRVKFKNDAGEKNAQFFLIQ